MMSGLRDFYNDCATQHGEQTSKLYQTISHSIAKELQDFHNSAAEVAIPEPHLPGLAGHETLIEFCTADDSMMGKVGKDSGVHVIRCSESHLNVEDKGTMKVLYNIVDTKPGVDLWGSLPCDPWSQWQTLNVHQYFGGSLNLWYLARTYDELINLSRCYVKSIVSSSKVHHKF
jgi:hypothetical protein